MLNMEWNATMQLKTVMACKAKLDPVFLVGNTSYNRLFLLYGIQLNLRYKQYLELTSYPGFIIEHKGFAVDY